MSWVRFHEEERVKGRKTKTWIVYSSQGDDFLGHVKWFSHWRQYCFYPESDTIWNPDCLHEVEEFCRMSTAWHKKQKERVSAWE